MRNRQRAGDPIRGATAARRRLCPSLALAGLLALILIGPVVENLMFRTIERTVQEWGPCRDLIQETPRSVAQRALVRTG